MISLARKQVTKGTTREGFEQRVRGHKDVVCARQDHEIVVKIDGDVGQDEGLDLRDGELKERRSKELEEGLDKADRQRNAPQPRAFACSEKSESRSSFPVSFSVAELVHDLERGNDSAATALECAESFLCAMDDDGRETESFAPSFDVLERCCGPQKVLEHLPSSSLPGLEVEDDLSRVGSLIHRPLSFLALLSEPRDSKRHNETIVQMKERE